ncbi:MAG: SDR family NAD(P)-dependent oxidoreductase [Bacteriovoracaceae bacterium]
MTAFIENKKLVVIGGNGGIGQAIRGELELRSCEVVFASRDCTHENCFQIDISDESSWSQFRCFVKERLGAIDGVINCQGFLHNKELAPEKSLRHYNLKTMQETFLVNTFSIALAAKYLIPLFERNNESLFVALSAKVGSLSDNRIGGWGSYRASKAALNMIMKNLLIELTQKKQRCRVLSIHPGTTKTALSTPFLKGVVHKIHEPHESAKNILSVIESHEALEQDFFKNWDGETLEF